jgi:3-dehydroquinate synthase
MMKHSKLLVKTEKPYEIHFTDELADEIAAFGEGTRFCIITDETVDELHGETLKNALKEKGLAGDLLVFPPGEDSKTIFELETILEFLAERHYSRSDMLIALGGGVIGDLVGFAAAVYLRGIRYIQIPTTLLACVDSSVGGKTAINLEAGKNLAGAFWQPSAVLINEDFLKTLPDEEYLCGLAEAIKCGVIGDRPLFDMIAKADSLEELRTAYDANGVSATAKIIARAVSLKVKLVQADEHDHGSRQLLNFGHTIAHAIETASDHEVSHGFAVATGMYMMTLAAEYLGYVDAYAFEDEKLPSEELREILLKYGYPLSYAFEEEGMLSYILNDKKISGNTINVVVPEEIGRCVIKKMPIPNLK